MVKYQNATTTWKQVVEEELDDYNNHQANNQDDLGYEY